MLKLSPDGAALEYSSYLGAGGFAFDGANGIAVDDEGSAYVTGFAGGGTFPTTPGVHDASHNGRNDVFVTKFDPSARRWPIRPFSVGRSATRATASRSTGSTTPMSPGSPPRPTSPRAPTHPTAATTAA